MRTIVAPTDFSADSLNVLNYAADMARTIHCNLLIVHVCVLPVEISEVPVIAYSLEELCEDAEIRLTDLKQKITARTGGDIKISTIVKQGDIIEQIKECCLSVNTYAVIMGRNDVAAVERFLFGSRTVAALKRLSFPLITVPPGASFKGIRNIGIACDFREVIETLPANEIKKIVTDLNAALHVLHVSKESGDSYSTRTIEESGWFQDLMGDITPKYHFIKGIDPEGEIIDFADKHHLDLLIIIPKKHGLMEKIFQHSHSKQLVLQAHVPVLAIHQ